jgi:5'-nucleotidase
MRINRLIAAAVIVFAVVPFQNIDAQQKKELNILHTSDTHSRIEPIKPGEKNEGMGGYARRASIVDDRREKDADLLLFDCGDFSQGTPYYNWYKGELEIRLMNLMKYDACTIGNHEFDFGLDNMARIFKMADFPVVCANYDVSATVLKDLVKPYITINRKGLKIGVFGLGAKLEGLVQKEKCEGIVFSDPVETAQKVAKKLREEEKCDVVICLSHLGQETDKDLMSKTSGLDLVLGGHSHTFMTETQYIPNPEGKLIALLHTGKNGVNVGELKMVLEEEK